MEAVSRQLRRGSWVGEAWKWWVCFACFLQKTLLYGMNRLLTVFSFRLCSPRHLSNHRFLLLPLLLLPRHSLHRHPEALRNRTDRTWFPATILTQELRMRAPQKHPSHRREDGRRVRKSVSACCRSGGTIWFWQRARRWCRRISKVPHKHSNYSTFMFYIYSKPTFETPSPRLFSLSG